MKKPSKQEQREKECALREAEKGIDKSFKITRRIFLNRSLAAGTAAGVAAAGWFPLLNTIDVASAATESF